jgi:hypothetical protein
VFTGLHPNPAAHALQLALVPYVSSSVKVPAGQGILLSPVQ